MIDLHELITILAAFLATSIAILRLAVVQNRTVTERLINHFENASSKQIELSNQLRTSLDSLSGNVHENSILVRQLLDWVQLSNPIGDSH